MLILTHFGRHVVCDAELQVRDDALHAVVWLLACGAQVLLHGACHRRKDGLSGFPRVHHLTRVLRGHSRLVLLETPDVCERFLYGHHQPNRTRHKGLKRTQPEMIKVCLSNRFKSSTVVYYASICNCSRNDFIKSQRLLEGRRRKDPHLALRLRIRRSISASS